MFNIRIILLSNIEYLHHEHYKRIQQQNIDPSNVYMHCAEVINFCERWNQFITYATVFLCYNWLCIITFLLAICNDEFIVMSNIQHIQQLGLITQLNLKLSIPVSLFQCAFMKLEVNIKNLKCNTAQFSAANFTFVVIDMPENVPFRVH